MPAAVEAGRVCAAGVADARPAAGRQLGTRLSVNVNKIAWLRNARGGARPDVAACARTALAAGAHGITVHPRPDGRHIRTGDVHALRQLVEEFAGAEFNVEGNPDAAPRGDYPGFDQLIEAARPHQATLVPDADDQLTSDHGWDLADDAAREALAARIARYRAWGVRVSLFLDPAPKQIRLAQEAGADRIELYTGPYSDAVLAHGASAAPAQAVWRRYRDAALCAGQLGLGVNAGHDLDQHNLGRLLAIGAVAEVSIGHALVADALDAGLEATVRRYLAICGGEVCAGEEAGAGGR